MVQRNSKQKGGGVFDKIRQGTSRSAAGRRHGLKDIGTGRSWLGRTKRRDFTLSSGFGGKSKLKFKGNNLKLITKERDASGKMIKTATKFKIDNHTKMEKLKSLKGDNLTSKLADMESKIQSGDHSEFGLKKLAKVEYSNKKLSSFGRGRKRAKATHIKYAQDDDGKNIIDTVTSRSGGIKSKSKYKYETGADGEVKLKSIDRRIKDETKVGHRFGRGSRRIRTDLDDNGAVIGVRRSRGLFSKDNRTKILRNDKGKVTSFQTSRWKTKKLSMGQINKHETEMNKLIEDKGLDSNFFKLDETGKFSEAQKNALIGFDKRKIKDMETKQRAIERINSGNQTRITSKLSKKYKGKKNNVKAVMNNDELKHKQIIERRNEKEYVDPNAGKAVTGKGANTGTKKKLPGDHADSEVGAKKSTDDVDGEQFGFDESNV
jgi:hypothetical protein